jgi:L,D-transpeptidase catalytic domain/LysM domain
MKAGTRSAVAYPPSMNFGSLFATFGLFASAPALTTPQPPGTPDLAPLFAAAQKDPAGVVPLLIEGSALMSTMDPKQAALLGDTLDSFAHRAFFGPERLPGMEKLGLVLHTVAKSENPTRIAQRYHIDAGLIAYLNRDYDERKLRPGTVLKVLDLSGASAEANAAADSSGGKSGAASGSAGDKPGSASGSTGGKAGAAAGSSGGTSASGAAGSSTLQLVVHKSSYRLSAWRTVSGGGRVLIAQIPVGLGANESPTPLGTTKITKRVLKPQWTNPVTKQTYADGDPNNVLGGYWIALDSEGIGKSGIGMHGYTGSAPANWIEQPASNGCVRMLQPDIDRVYRLALEGTPVVIVQ